MGGGGGGIPIITPVFDAARGVAGAIGGAIGGGEGRKIGEAIGDPLGLGSQEAPRIEAPDEDPRLKYLRDQQREQAEAFRNQRQGMTEEATQGLADRERGRLAQDLAGIKRDYASRGLLYSGLRQGQELGAKARSASNVAGYKRQVQEQMSQTQRELDRSAITGDLVRVQTTGQIQDALYNQALENMRSRSSTTGAILGAAGSIVGDVLAKDEKKKDLLIA